MKTTRSRYVLGWFLFGTIAAGCASTPRVEVSAGRFDREYTPVHVDVALSPGRMNAPCCVAWDGRRMPAQVEPLPNGVARVWWMIPRLPAGRNRTYRILFGTDCAKTDAPVFTWRDSSQGGVKSMDLLYGTRPVLRYVYTPFDGSSEETIEQTKKPFHHVFAPDGSRLITKGPGGKYSHHRGIFFGYNRIQADGGPYDTWHAAKGDHQEHVRVLRSFTGPVMGGHVVEILWKSRRGQVLAVEKRRVVAFASPPDEILIEFSTTLEQGDAPVVLASTNSHHGGVQFRAAQEVAENEQATRYLRPARWADLPPDREAGTDKKTGFVYKDLPWDAMCFKLGGRTFTVAYLTDPANPGDADFSERLYGRFGEYFPWKLDKAHPLHARYRWWVVADKHVTREQVQSKYEALAHPPRVMFEP